MANNLKELRLAFLLTPTEFASRIGTDAAQVERLERPDRELEPEWIEAVSRGLGVPPELITDPHADFRSTASPAAGQEAARTALCPIGLRYALLAAVAKLGGTKLANSLNEDALMTALQNVIRYVDRDDEPSEEETATRLYQALQITVLTILESRGVDHAPQLQKATEQTLRGSTQLALEYSRRTD